VHEQLDTYDIAKSGGGMSECRNVDVGSCCDNLVAESLVYLMVGFENLILVQVLSVYLGNLIACGAGWMGGLSGWMIWCNKWYVASELEVFSC
jgi:energy-converting hydrogenase Eha subunit B